MLIFSPDSSNHTLVLWMVQMTIRNFYDLSINF